MIDLDNWKACNHHGHQAGAGLFVVGGVADGVWHTLFGIEAGVAALLSPSHLLLLCGGLLMVTSPIRSAWSSPELPARSPAVALLPALWATALTTAVVLFFFQYLSAFVSRAPSAVVAEGPAGLPTTIVGVASVLVTNVIVVAPVLLLARRWRLPFGTVALVVTTGAAGLTALREFSLGALVPLLLWGAWMLAYGIAYGIAWPPELWAGTLGMACLSGLGLSLLALPPAVPDEAWVRG